MSEYHRQHRLANREILREKDRAYYRRTREVRLAYQARWREENQEKRNAQHRLQRAVKAGKLTRPNHCERCSIPGRIDAHHTDYSKPLDVQWLCTSCHMTEHKNREQVRTFKWGRWGT